MYWKGVESAILFIWIHSFGLVHYDCLKRFSCRQKCKQKKDVYSSSYSVYSFLYLLTPTKPMHLHSDVPHPMWYYLSKALSHVWCDEERTLPSNRFIFSWSLTLREVPPLAFLSLGHVPTVQSRCWLPHFFGKKSWLKRRACSFLSLPCLYHVLRVLLPQI